MKTTLLIMAAGIGSRFGGGIKQLEPVGIHGEIIMDYSIHDAIEAGFNRIVFIIRRDIEEDFKEVIGNRIGKVCEKLGVEIGYAYQSLEAVPEGAVVPEGRKKPWGTGQAVLAAKDLIHEPFVVINADDYYGKEAFRKIHEFLLSCDPASSMNFCMAGFILKNTLSENGGVTRGICGVDADGYLTDVIETSDIVKTASGAAVNGMDIDAGSYVSMNMWGLTPEFLPVLEKGFEEFFEEMQPSAPLKAEYLLPVYIGQLLREKKVSVKVLETADKWFGVTYKEDKESVVESFRRLTEAGVYKEELFSDL
ncbi:MAG: NDP-sugar synthase [Lachnospiraceae bacterium]